jgi:hypothetical protein
LIFERNKILNKCLRTQIAEQFSHIKRVHSEIGEGLRQVTVKKFTGPEIIGIFDIEIYDIIKGILINYLSISHECCYLCNIWSSGMYIAD